MVVKPTGQPEQAGYGNSQKIGVVCIFVHKFPCNVNDTRALIDHNKARFDIAGIAKPSL